MEKPHKMTSLILQVHRRPLHLLILTYLQKNTHILIKAHTNYFWVA